MESVRIEIVSLLEGARSARGWVVIIDVYRAMTTLAVAFSRGARAVRIAADPAEALRLRSTGGGDLCAGEVDGRRPPGFDFGNSPSELSRAELQGKTLILSTRAGAVGLEAAVGAERLFGGAFVNAAATAQFIAAARSPLVTLAAMGWSARERTDEDELCALVLRNRLEGRTPDPAAVRALALAGGESQKFGDPAQPWFPRADLEMALDFDRFDFAVEVVRDSTGLTARRRVPPRIHSGG